MPELEDRTLGDVIDALGVDLEGLTDDDLVTDVIVIAKAARLETGETLVFTGITAGMSWIEKRGMIEIARDDARQPVAVAEDED